MIEKILKEKISGALEELKISGGGNILLEYPADISHGDFSTNVAMALAKEAGKSPKSLSEEIKSELEKNLPKEISKVEVAGAGFINFFLSKEFFESSIKSILESKVDVGKGNALSGKKILFEYSGANAFKPFHIGHLMATTIGDALSHIAEAQGADVKRICYGGDVGLHVAKTIWGMQKEKSAFPHDDDSLSDKVKFLGDAYVLGNTAYEENEKAKEEIKEINKKVFTLFEKSVEKDPSHDQEIKLYYEKGRAWSLAKFDEIFKKLGTEFSKKYYESDMASIGKEMVEKNIANIFKKSEGAVIFSGEEYGLHTRVFITSENLPTYEAKELGFFFIKEKDFPQSDTLITVTANEQNDYFKVVSKVLSLINPKLGEKFTHISHGLLRFAEGKMSSRKGNVITGESLLNDVEEEVAKKIADRDLTDAEKKNIAEAVAVSAIKYSILRQRPGKDIIFDKEKALSFEGDSGPYLQYALVRAYALLEKGKEEGVYPSAVLPEDWKTFEIERMLPRFENILISSWREKAPQVIVEYLTQIASSFNAFYAEGRIVDKKDPTSPYRLAVTEAFSKVLEGGLHILGIHSLRKM